MKTVNAVSWVGAVALAASLAVVIPAFAQTNVNVGAGVNVGAQGGFHNGANGGARYGGMQPGIFGTVSAVNGDTLTVVSGGHFMRPMPEQASGTPVTMASTTYTVNATNAQIYKGTATTTVSISDIAVGDTVIVQGTVSGTSITATVIRDGVEVPMVGQPGGPIKRVFGGHGASSTASGTPPIQGNGEPVIGGNVTAVSGTSITVTNASNVTYAIDAASTTIVKNGTSTTIGNIAVGDSLIVQGTVNGNSVTASSIIDQGVKGANGSSTNGSSTKPKGGPGFGFGGIFSAIGGFFQHLFGF